MPIFSFYSYEIKQAEDKVDLFAGVNGTEDKNAASRYSSPEDCFGSFFVSGRSIDLPVLKSSGRGSEKITEWDKYRCEVMRHEDGVILMTIENNKVKHTIVDKKDKENPHHPFCTVLIDNRPGNQTIGIEKNSAFDGKPDKVAGIMKMAMSSLMAPYHLEVELTHLKKKSTEFWPVVNDLRTKFKDIVKQIRLDFNGKEDEADANDVVRVMSAIAKKANSEAVFMLNAEGDQEIMLQEVYDDLTSMAEICLKQKGYDLSVKFKNFGVYRYGADLLAQFGVDEKVIENFENGIQEFDFDRGGNIYMLVEWLDKLAELLKGYKKHAISEGRKGRSRRQVRR